MSKKIGRNDLCPCGSGKKYKNCCLGKKDAAAFSERHDNKDAVTIAARWLMSAYGKDMDEVLTKQFYGSMERRNEVFKNALGVGDGELLSANMEEWMVTEAFIPYEGEITETPDIIYNSSVPKLTGADYSYLDYIAYVPLLLYEVQKVDIDKGGMWVVDLLKKGKPFFTYSDNAASFKLWDIFGARYLGEDYGNTFTASYYPFEREFVLDYIKKIDKFLQEHKDADTYATYTTMIPMLWLENYEEKEEEDFTIHIYEVSDWEALEKILNSREDLKKIYDYVWTSTLEEYTIKRVKDNLLYLDAPAYKEEEARDYFESLAGALAAYKDSLDFEKEEAEEEEEGEGEGEGEEKTLDDSSFKERLIEMYGEEWLNYPNLYLGGISPLEAAKDETMSEKLMELIKNTEQFLLYTLKEYPEEIDLWGRLGIRKPVLPE